MIPNVHFIWENKAGVWYIHRPLNPPTPGAKSIFCTFEIALRNSWIYSNEKVRLRNPLTGAFYDIDFEDFDANEAIDRNVLTTG